MKTSGLAKRVASGIVGFIKSVIGSWRFTLFIAAWMIVNTITSLWAHDIVWSVIFGIIGLANFAVAITNRTPTEPPIMQLVVPGLFNPERIEDLDARLAECARKLGQEPTAEQMIKVVTDLRGIVNDLHP